MPDGQESPTRGMGVWARVVVAAVTRMKQDRYLRMVAPPGCRLGSV